ncbi:universal stress protein [Cenarchaeum symbiosum A]|uniref:Universal stress protein n=1 Tax=Cenarchaeum symbiosum (strain A) TaxID=414004 RepID=A0RX81_CENSY|nr:universal stress protein [Cenarchaeum symbiosum A]
MIYTGTVREIKKILVPIDGSPNSKRGLEMAITLARQCGATLTGLISIETPPVSELKGVGSVSKSVQQEAKGFLEEAKTASARKGIVFRSKLVHGNIGYNIIREAHSKDGPFDLVVVGSRGRSRTREAFFGSVSNYVVHESKVPVLVVK